MSIDVCLGIYNGGPYSVRGSQSLFRDQTEDGTSHRALGLRALALKRTVKEGHQVPLPISR